MLVPFATCSAAECAQALATLRLPHLQRLLARLAPESTESGDPNSLSTPHERVLARAWQLPPTEGLIPFAALQIRRGGAPEAQAEAEAAAPMADDAGAAWAWISPSHWRVGRDRIAMAHPQDLQLDADDSHTLLQAMQPYFAEDGITLAYHAPLRWLARGEAFRHLPTASLDRVVGRTLDPWMPAGEAGRPLRRLQQEMQMLLYTLDLNDARQRGGLLPVNSFWVSGTGALPAGYQPPASSGLQVSPYLRDAALQGDWRAWAAAWEQLDLRDCARLAKELERGREVRITLCGEAGSRTWSSRAAGGWRRLLGRLRPVTPAQSLEGL